MLSIEQAKQMAAKLKSSLEMRGHKISYSAALETVSQQLGYKDWNTASAALLPPVVPQPQIHFIKTIPILRMFDERKAREFYLEFLSFSVEFEHR
ncbi:glyoxalase superfamily protein, partial [Escherichia coli]|uniref:glyoxalase superfamily protein n=2 Tax=Enterobacterales TaxID=91347 RepID=UPI003FA5C6E9